MIAGLHGGARTAHLARAALEAIANRVGDIVEAIAEVAPVLNVRADGGLSNDPTLMRLQADALEPPLIVGAADATVLGAALLAGVGAGIFPDIAQAGARLTPGNTIFSTGTAADRSRRRLRWREFRLVAQGLAEAQEDGQSSSTS